MTEVSHRFTHLQVHSHFTLLGATPSVEGLASQAAAEGMSHLVLSDTNALYGAVAFDRACRKVGVQAVLGMTITAPPPDAHLETPGRLVLLARGPAGYRSLCRLSTLIQGGPERERRRPLAGMDGDGFFLGDGETFITVRGAKSGRAWDPMLVHGRPGSAQSQCPCGGHHRRQLSSSEAV